MLLAKLTCQFFYHDRDNDPALSPHLRPFGAELVAQRVEEPGLRRTRARPACGAKGAHQRMWVEVEDG